MARPITPETLVGKAHAKATQERWEAMANNDLRCGHPDRCLGGDSEDDLRCLWCEEVRNLQGLNKALREQLHRTAIVIHGGEHVLTIASEIGLLEILGGTVNFPDMAKLVIGSGSTIGRVADERNAKEAVRPSSEEQTSQV